MGRGDNYRSDRQLTTRILECQRLGLTSAQTARVCDITTEYARDIAKRHGVEFRKSQNGYKKCDFENTAIVAAVLADDSMSDEEIAVATNTSASTVRRFRQVNKVYKKSLSSIEKTVYRAVYDAYVEIFGEGK